MLLQLAVWVDLDVFGVGSGNQILGRVGLSRHKEVVTVREGSVAAHRAYQILAISGAHVLFARGVRLAALLSAFGVGLAEQAL